MRSARGPTGQWLGMETNGNGGKGQLSFRKSFDPIPPSLHRKWAPHRWLTGREHPNNVTEYWSALLWPGLGLRRPARLVTTESSITQ